VARTKDAYVPELIHPNTVDEAASELARLGEDGEAIAGATWVMLGPLYRRPTKMHYVAVGRVPELTNLVVSSESASIGAAVTFSQIADSVDSDGPLAVLREAALGTPRAIGNVATVAGNICVHPYPAADMVPALLVLDASVDVRNGDVATTQQLDGLSNAPFGPGSLVTGVSAKAISPRALCCYERLTVRASGEEAVASVAVALELDGGAIKTARVAFGALETRSRRCAEVEAALVGGALGDETAIAAGNVATEALDVVGGPDAPADYKRQILPGLMKRALARLAANGKDA
jgi:carbon-monoxide dehydrogenase medium subunit